MKINVFHNFKMVVILSKPYTIMLFVYLFFLKLLKLKYKSLTPLHL